MKRFFITLAVALMIVPTVNAQSKAVQKALKELAKAKEAVKLTEKAVSLEEFNKLFEKENKESKSKKK